MARRHKEKASASEAIISHPDYPEVKALFDEWYNLSIEVNRLKKVWQSSEIRLREAIEKLEAEQRLLESYQKEELRQGSMIQVRRNLKPHQKAVDEAKKEVKATQKEYKDKTRECEKTSSKCRRKMRKMARNLKIKEEDIQIFLLDQI